MRSVDSQPQFGQRMTDSIIMSNTISDLGAQERIPSSRLAGPADGSRFTYRDGASIEPIVPADVAWRIWTETAP